MSISRITSTIPVLSLRTFYSHRQRFVSGLSDAFRRFGFVGLTETNIKTKSLAALYEKSKVFFNLDRDKKEEISGQKIGGERGYTGSSESPAGQPINIKDVKEFIHFGREGHHDFPKNKWSKYVDLKKPVMDVYSQLSDLAMPIAVSLEEATNAIPGSIEKMVKEGDHLLRLVRYPASLQKGGVGAAAHTDSNYFTILPAATERGLELFINGTWIQIKVPQEAVVVNAGSMLEHMTNGYFHSALHRVVKFDDGKEDRYSLAYFVHSGENDMMTPLAPCIKKTGGIKRYPEASRQYLLYQRLFAMQRTTPSMTEKFKQWGGVKRWEPYLAFHDPKTELMKEISKVKALLQNQTMSL